MELDSFFFPLKLIRNFEITLLAIEELENSRNVSTL